MMENVQTEKLLGSAFKTFRDASMKLEQQYSMLERKIEVLNTEIAEKNKAMERTRRLAAMGEMAAKIAHEIRNPLGSMAIFASLLERDLSGDSERKRLAEQITRGIKTLDNLLSNMLLFAGAPEARCKPVDVRELIEESILLSRGREKEDVEIKTSYKGPKVINADEGLLRQLFLNLILNSLDAMDGGGTLAVTTRPGAAGSFDVEVSDTGKGIAGENIDRIFDPFFSTKDRGTGLGMAIVATVVNAHRGQIDVRSTEGSGTTFLISLPNEMEEG